MASPTNMLVPAITLLFFAASTTADYVLYTGEVLLAGQNLTNGRYRLSMHRNCDLVLYDDDNPTWRPIAAAISDDDDYEGVASGNCYLTLKHTGELILRRNVHYTLWTSASKSKKGKYALVLNGKGSLGVYGMRRWITSNPKEKGKLGGRSHTKYVLHSGQKLFPASPLVYKDLELSLAHCNMAIKERTSGRVLWQTNTKANSCSLEMEGDGQLMLKRGSNSLWSSNKKGESGQYVAVLRFDGRLAVYGPMLWSNDMTHDEDSGVYDAMGLAAGL